MINLDFNSVIELIENFPDEQTCINHLEQLRWNGNVVSPFDPTSKVYKCAGNKYRCKNSGKYFNVRTGTMFDNTKVALQKWFVAIYLLTGHKKGISSLQLSRDLNVTQKTAWFMAHRIRNCYGLENDEKLDNEVEIDESFFGGKNKNRHTTKKIENVQGRSVKDKTPVLGMVERQGKLVAKTIENTRSETLTPQIINAVKDSAKIYTDEWLGYNELQRIYNHTFVKHNENQYVNGSIHINTIEGFWSLLKRGIVGIYHFTSKKHLQKYVDEFAFRYNTRTETEFSRFNLLLAHSTNRLTYKELIK
jgi:transposase-like protein